MDIYLATQKRRKRLYGLHACDCIISALCDEHFEMSENGRHVQEDRPPSFGAINHAPIDQCGMDAARDAIVATFGGVGVDDRCSVPCNYSFCWQENIKLIII